MDQSVDKATAATTVYEKLRHDILAGDLKPGEKLGIEAISSRYATGLNPVREALNRLSSEGLVDRKERRGFFVPPLSIENLRELVKTRCWLEGKALQESIEHRTSVWEERIVLSFHRLSRTPWSLPEKGSITTNPEWERYHYAFHLALISGCGSERLIEFCKEMMDQAVRYRNISVSQTYPHRNTIEEHREIMDAALDGDIDSATERLRAHYRRTLKALEDQI
ncbi:GntR family transcriptional regulator [Fodinicurvata sp. EGI_FJ10296]|jgi:DNA-binding GntR family transcriptional regulator|uniref:GntR family transcriptional regulator n=1 Tax=Fodinicurvata sp. EGI_FJ10296 TaxID=3231908 RepID=UPI003452033F